LSLPSPRFSFFKLAWCSFFFAGIFVCLGFNYILSPLRGGISTAATSKQAPSKISVPSGSPANDERTFIPGRNFDEMLQRLGSNESMINVILNSMGGVAFCSISRSDCFDEPSAEKILDMTEKEGLGKHYLEVVRHPVLAELLKNSKTAAFPAGK